MVVEVKEGLTTLFERSKYSVKAEDPLMDLSATKKEKYNYFIKIVPYGVEGIAQGVEILEKKKQEVNQGSTFALVYPCTLCGKPPEPNCDKCKGITGGDGCRLVTREEAKLIEQAEDTGINIWGFDTIKEMIFLLAGSYPKDPTLLRELYRGGTIAKPHIGLIRR